MAAAVNEQSDSIVFSTRRVRRATPLLHEGAQLESLYFIGAGTFKCTQTDPDGGEQVHEFAMKGDALGLDALCCGRHAGGAVALEDSMVAVVPFRDFVEAGHRLAVLEQMLHRVVARDLRRRNHTMQLMVTVGADVRLARFLLDWAQRQGELGYSTRRLRLRMTRIDIASHLGVAHETISRSLGALAQAGLIRVHQRDIDILDEDALHALHAPPRGGAPLRLQAVSPDVAPCWPAALRMH
jgi:CRP/FNR family transcriptional regulator